MLVIMSRYSIDLFFPGFNSALYCTVTLYILLCIPLSVLISFLHTDILLKHFGFWSSPFRIFFGLNHWIAHLQLYFSLSL
jgi:hypothetical protein